MLNQLSQLFKPFPHVPQLLLQDTDIREIPTPEMVVIPLEYPGQVLYQPLVKIGEQVRQNQIIGRSKLGNCVHASISGTVKDIISIWTNRGFNVPAVMIKRNEASPLGIGELFDQYGITQSGASRLDKLMALGSVSPWAQPGRFHHEEDLQKYPPVTDIIIKGKNEEPTIFVFELLLQQFPEIVNRGVKHILELSPKARCWLTIPEALHPWATEKIDRHVKSVPLSQEYKDRIERRIVPKITGQNISNMTSYRDYGVAVLSVEYLINLVNAIEGKSPFIYKYATIAGHGLTTPITVKFPIGTTIRWVMESLELSRPDGGRVVVGGPMKGIAQYNDLTPLTKSSHGIFLVSKDELPLEVNMTCFNCGQCTRACPSNLQVHLIGRYAEYGMFRDTKQFHPEACNECGLCGYVCPAHRPLVQLIQMCNQYGGVIDDQYHPQAECRVKSPLERWELDLQDTAVLADSVASGDGGEPQPVRT